MNDALCYAGCCPSCGRVIVTRTTPCEEEPNDYIARWWDQGLDVTTLSVSEAEALKGCDCEGDEEEL